MFERYSGLTWTDSDRNDGWPDWENHQYQVLVSGLGSDETTSTAELPVVKELIPQFWAHTQALAKAWYTFTDGLHSHDDEWNQSVSTLIHSVCQLARAANMLPEDYEPWYKFLKVWIDNFTAARLQRMKDREVPAEVISVGSAGQGNAGGVSPLAEPSSALSGQGDASEEISGASSGSMSEEQKAQQREQQEAWARIHGTPPPKESTAGVVKKVTHRYEQWLEGELKANRGKLDPGDLPPTDQYFQSDAEKRARKSVIHQRNCTHDWTFAKRGLGHIHYSAVSDLCAKGRAVLYTRQQWSGRAACPFEAGQHSNHTHQVQETSQ